VLAQGKHIDLCAPATDRPWQRYSSSQKGLYNHLITRAVNQREPRLALTVSASCIPARGWARDWSVLMASSRLMTCDSVARARFTKVIGGSGGVNAISYYLKSNSKQKSRGNKPEEWENKGWWVWRLHCSRGWRAIEQDAKMISFQSNKSQIEIVQHCFSQI